MSIVQPLIVLFGLIALSALGYFAFAGPSLTREGARRLQTVRDRHSESTKDKVEAQLRKAVAARKPKMLVAIALANKMARAIWAMLTKQEDYRVPAAVIAV